MTEKQFAAKVDEELQDDGYGFDPATILTILSLLLPIIQQLPCFKKSAAKMRANIDAEYRECCRKRKGRCPPKARAAMKKNGVTDREEQDDLWAAACKVAFVNNEAVAAMLAK